MTVLKPRSRTISVRLSEDEYLTLRRICSLTGARSVSHLTREAMRSVLGDVNREVPFRHHLAEFRADMESLEKKVEQLEAKITAFKAEGTS
jgi:ubiquinone biosynthesis protein UbiJ